MPLTNVTRGSLIDVAEVLDTPVKLVTIKNFKMSNSKMMTTTAKN